PGPGRLRDGGPHRPGLLARPPLRLGPLGGGVRGGTGAGRRGVPPGLAGPAGRTGGSEPQAAGQAVRRLGPFLGFRRGLGAAVGGLAYLLGGEESLVFSSTALGLCLVPALLTMGWAEWTFRRAPEQLLVTVLGGTGLRLFVVLAAALVVNHSLAYFQKRS